MKTPRIANAMEYIDDDLVSGAVTYTRQKRKWWANWKAIAACVAAVAIILGAIPFLNSNPNAPIGSPFVLTAYAAGIDDEVSAIETEEWERVPVSMFETNNGLRGFVFSYSIDDFDQPISISIINADEQIDVDGAIESIIGIEMDKSQKYIFFIPPQDEAAPYSLPLTIQDEDSNTVALLTLLIEQADEGFTSKIIELTSYPRKEAP